MILDCKRLMPDQFLQIADLAPEWSLARSLDELALYVRYSEDGPITMYLGPNKFWCNPRQLTLFEFRLKSRILRARQGAR
jgi:hypothetical protein